MRSLAADALELIQATALLLEEEPPVLLSSAEDTAYFRKLYSPPKPAPIPALIPAPPPPLPPPSSSPPPSSLKSLFAKIAPDFPLLDTIPSDAFAKKIASRWKTKNQIAPITVLSLHEPPPQKALLEAIAKALDVYFGPAKLLSAETFEKEKQWDICLSTPDLKLIVVCDYTLWQLSSLMPFYKDGARKLGNVPLFLLPDLSLYFKDPLLKRSLWKALCQKLSS